MKIGILGGTFDPIHNTHISMAREALSQLNLDKVFLMPSFCPPHKNSSLVTNERHRVNMVKLAVAGLDNISYSDFELKNRLSYTADTLTALKQQHPKDELFFIIGGDSISTFISWYHPEIILEKANLVVVKRNDVTLSAVEDNIAKIRKTFNIHSDKKIFLLDTDISSISSSFIRNNNIEECKSMLPKEVYEYIRDNGLYMGENKNCSWTVSEIDNDLKKLLSPHRYSHTLGVALTSKEMAENYGVNPNTAYLAGLLHDCAKYYTNEELLNTCKKNNIPVTQAEKNAPYLLHGKVGAFVAKTKYHIEDETVLSAITWHTTGKPQMTKLEQIVFCADYIEPGRDKQPNLAYLRGISMKNLDLLTFKIMSDTLNYLKSKNQVIDNYTRQGFEFYKKKVGED
ncbi:nicotinate (nicotinamide) nucleotide adenylyltransferase [Eubacterium sp.]